MMWWDWRR